MSESVSNEIKDFFNKNRRKKAPLAKKIFPLDEKGSVNPQPPIPWYPLYLPQFPRKKILNEARAIKHLFVEHRPNEGNKGWKSICIHGLSSHQTQAVNDDQSKNYQWTEIAKLCPVTYQYFTQTFPAIKYERLRFMLVEPGGYIAPHVDKMDRGLGPLAICLNSPRGCDYVLEGVGRLPLKEGWGALVDISYKHSVWNQSNKDRFHILVEKDCGERFSQYQQLFVKTYEKINPFSFMRSEAFRRFKNK
jgi:hypothetical protein